MDTIISNIQQVPDYQNKTFAATKKGITGIVSVPFPCVLVTDDGNSYTITAETHVIAFDKDGHVWPVTHEYVKENYIIHEVGIKAWKMVRDQSLEESNGRNAGEPDRKTVP